MRLKNLSLLCFILLLFSCANEKEEYSDTKRSLDVPEYILLHDDSTNIAGVLKIKTSASEVNLKWNVPANCNIDTTKSIVSIKNGELLFPIHWNKRIGKSFGPKDKVFNVGVTIATDKQDRYVSLLWTHEIDSISLKKIGGTRAGETEPTAVVIQAIPDLVPMDKDLGGAVLVFFTGTPAVSIDATSISASTNIDKTKIPLTILQTGTEVPLKWNASGAPTTGFTTQLRISTPGVVFPVPINYIVPTDDPAYWAFMSSTPANNGTLSAKNAQVTVNSKTNKPWSIECADGLISPVNDTSTDLGTRPLVMHIEDNPNNTSRTISIAVYSQGVLKETLTFTQAANTGGGGEDTGTAFTFISSEPADKGNISAIGGAVTVKVNTDYAWWIDIDGTKTNYEAGALGDKTGTIAIPANIGTTDKTITVTVGHGTTVVKTLTFTQPGNGGGGLDGELTYVSSDLPDGNIPAGGKSYTFTFTGKYTGNFRIRALNAATNELINRGTIGTTYTPKLTITPNPTNATRSIKFQYKKTDVTSAKWVDLPASTDRIQDASGDTGSVTPGTLSPTGALSEYGALCSCTFNGDFTGTIIMRATDGQQELARNTGKANSTISVQVPLLNGMDRTITLEYSLDGGKTWIMLGNRQQINETFLPSGIQPVSEKIPAKGGEYSWNYRGTYSKEVKFEVATVEPDGTYKILSLQSSTSARSFTYVVPPNTGAQRAIGFRYKMATKENWTIIQVLRQDGPQ